MLGGLIRKNRQPGVREGISGSSKTRFRLFPKTDIAYLQLGGLFIWTPRKGRRGAASLPGSAEGLRGAAHQTSAPRIPMPLALHRAARGPPLSPTGRAALVGLLRRSLRWLWMGESLALGVCFFPGQPGVILRIQTRARYLPR